MNRVKPSGMNIRVLTGLCTLLSLFILVQIVSAGPALTDDDTAFLSDILTSGIPMLYQTPEAMNIGVYYGRDSAIADIASKKSEALLSFTEKIKGYTLSPETTKIRDSWLIAADKLKADLEEYGTLIPGCGSCVAAMNEMYPDLLASASSFQKEFIAFYKKNQVTP